jgi:hypothetical protein
LNGCECVEQRGGKSAIANAGFDLVRKHISKGAGAPGNGPESDLTQGGEGTSLAGHNAEFKTKSVFEA